MRPATEFGAALALLTRLPGGWLVRGTWPDAARCVWAYPLVGALVGGIGGAVLRVAEWTGVPALPACVLAIGMGALVTGGLHEDGLADMADGLGGRTQEARLAIMRDSRIGAHGALALVLVVLLRAGALASMTGTRAATALVVAAALGRGSMLLVIGGAPPARSEGLGASVAGASRARLGLGLVLAAAMAMLAEGGGAVLAALSMGLVAAAMSRRAFGGMTGDVLGASALLGESAALLAFCARP